MECEWDYFSTSLITPARQIILEFYEEHKHLFSKICESCNIVLSRIKNLDEEPDKTPESINNTIRSVCSLACQKHFRKEFSDYVLNILQPTKFPAKWEDLMNQLISSRKFKLKPVCNVYNPGMNKSFE